MTDRHSNLWMWDPLLRKSADPVFALRSARAKTFPIRFWVVDNSGSMGLPDGQKLAKDSTGNFKMIQTTRWQELLKDIEDVGTLSQTVGSRTEFYPINPADSPPLVVTGEGRSGEVAAVCAGLGAPHSSTPLAETTKRVADKITAMVEQSNLMPGEKACVVIATDGEPNDKAAFKREVERLLKLPVWLIFRLCTNEESVVAYYNELDEQRKQSRVEPTRPTTTVIHPPTSILCVQSRPTLRSSTIWKARHRRSPSPATPGLRMDHRCSLPECTCQFRTLSLAETTHLPPPLKGPSFAYSSLVCRTRSSILSTRPSCCHRKSRRFAKHSWAALAFPNLSWTRRPSSPASKKRWLSSRMCSTRSAERCSRGSRRTSSRPDSAEGGRKHADTHSTNYDSRSYSRLRALAH